MEKERRGHGGNGRSNETNNLQKEMYNGTAEQLEEEMIKERETGNAKERTTCMTEERN